MDVGFCWRILTRTLNSWILRAKARFQRLFELVASSWKTLTHTSTETEDSQPSTQSERYRRDAGLLRRWSGLLSIFSAAFGRRGMIFGMVIHPVESKFLMSRKQRSW